MHPRDISPLLILKEDVPLFGPVPSGNKIPEDGDSRVAQKPDWNRNSESKAFPEPPCVTLPGTPESSCPR